MLGPWVQVFVGVIVMCSWSKLSFLYLFPPNIIKQKLVDSQGEGELMNAQSVGIYLQWLGFPTRREQQYSQSLNCLTLQSDWHLISPYSINPESCIMVRRIIQNDHQLKKLLIAIHNLLVKISVHVWRTVQRIIMHIDVVV